MTEEEENSLAQEEIFHDAAPKDTEDLGSDELSASGSKECRRPSYFGCIMPTPLLQER